MKKILVIDIGGTHVKLMISRREKRKFDSGPKLTPKQLVAEIVRAAEGWEFEAIAIGFPAVVKNGRIVKEPNHLGKGWIGSTFARSLGKPARVINDAAMQALGSYHGGRMLFLGLGTGLGSALVWPGHVLSLELGGLPYPGGKIEDRLGNQGLEELGDKKWQREVAGAVTQLKLAMIADYVVLGGGNARLIAALPAGVEPGDNRNAYRGGCRMWETDRDGKRPKWRVL